MYLSWLIEVFFKMCKQHLKLVKEIQIRNYDGLIVDCRDLIPSICHVILPLLYTGRV